MPKLIFVCTHPRLGTRTIICNGLTLSDADNADLIKAGWSVQCFIPNGETNTISGLRQWVKQTCEER